MTYYEMLKAAQKSGTTNEQTMWKSVASISELLDKLKESHKDLYWSFMRNQYGFMSGCHYDKVWAEYDVSQMHYTDKEGKKHTGAYWTVEQIEEATKGLSFPTGVTKWDKFVAFNGLRADLCKVFTDEQILKATHAFFFMDEDWDENKPGSSPTKVWEYFSCKHEK